MKPVTRDLPRDGPLRGGPPGTGLPAKGPSGKGIGVLLVSATVSRLADQSASIALVLLVIGRTHNPRLAGLVVAAFTVPTLVTGPVITHHGPVDSALESLDRDFAARGQAQRRGFQVGQHPPSVPARQPDQVSGYPVGEGDPPGQPALVRQFPFLPVLKQAILTARPRPSLADYSQFTIVPVANTLSAPGGTVKTTSGQFTPPC